MNQHSKTNTAKIVRASILTPADWMTKSSYGNALVSADLDDGREGVTVFWYYNDELSFSPGEFVGMTIDEACELKFKRDVAYLRS